MFRVSMISFTETPMSEKIAACSRISQIAAVVLFFVDKDGVWVSFSLAF